MNKNLQKIKYIIFALVLVSSGILSADRASAVTYTYNCSDGGTISSVVTLNPSGPFSADAPSSFQANASMYSNSCGDRQVYLTGQNNSGAVTNIISQQLLALNGIINNQYIVLTSPSEGGDYNVNLVTWVDEPPLPNINYSNKSLATVIQDIQINGAQIPGLLTTGYGHTAASTVDIYMQWSLGLSDPGGHTDFYDTYGNLAGCVIQQRGDPDPTYYLYNVDMTGPSPLIIDVLDGEYCM